MAWSWSHTEEAYEKAERNLRRMGVTKLRTIWAEWKVKLAETEEETGWDQEVYDAALKEAKAKDKEALVSDIWEWMSGWDNGRTCDNGGFNAWACPFGCSCHTVSFG